ncbi:hypothetical protein V8E54_003799 [Elaphomyces granulatus]
MTSTTPDTPVHQSDQQIEYPTVQTIIGEPLPDAEYESHEAVENAYRQHALGKGYGVVKVDTGGLKKYSKKRGRKVVFGCDRWGKYDPSKALRVNPEVHESKRRKGSSRKCNCPFRIVAIEDPVTLKWKAFIKEEHHNHDPSSEPTSHPSHRRASIANLSESSKQMVDTLLINTPVRMVRAQLGDMGVKVVSKDLYNMVQRASNARLEA